MWLSPGLKVLLPYHLDAVMGVGEQIGVDPRDKRLVSGASSSCTFSGENIMNELNAVVEVTPVVAANTGRLAVWAKKGLEAAKAGGMVTVAGMAFGAQAVLFIGGAAVVFYGAKKTLDLGEKMYDSYQAKQAAKTVTPPAAPPAAA